MLEDFENKMDLRFKMLIKLLMAPTLDTDSTDIFSPRESGILAACGFVADPSKPGFRFNEEQFLGIEKRQDGSWVLFNEIWSTETHLIYRARSFTDLLMCLTDDNCR